MQTLQGLKRKIKSAEELHSVVRTMKSLAAINIRQYDEAVHSLDDYYRTVEMGLRALLLHHPPPTATKPPGWGVVAVIGSDQGMVGQFNETIVRFAQKALPQDEIPPEGRRLWVAGAKAAGHMEDILGGFDRSFAPPSSAETITETVQEITLQFDREQRQRGEGRFVLFYNRPVSGAAYTQERMHLVPPDEDWLSRLGAKRWVGRSLPAHSLPWPEIFPALIGEYLFVAIFRAFAASMAAENAARLASMQRAEKNIEDLRDTLTAQYHALRQNSITEELFDVISGFEALTAEQASSGQDQDPEATG